MQLIKNAKLTRAVLASNGVAGSSNINGVTLDMQNYEGVLIEVTFGVITSGAATSIKAQQDSASGMGTAQDLLGTSQTVADDDDNEIFVIDIYRPEKRYIRLVVLRATQNSVVTATYIQYGPKKMPTTQATGINVESFVSPIEGTA